MIQESEDNILSFFLILNLTVIQKDQNQTEITED